MVIAEVITMMALRRNSYQQAQKRHSRIAASWGKQRRHLLLLLL